jgi:hypothetical protein
MARLKCNGSRTFLSAGAVALPGVVAPSVPVAMARSGAAMLRVGRKRDREFGNGHWQLVHDGVHRQLLDDRIDGQLFYGRVGGQRLQRTLGGGDRFGGGGGVARRRTILEPGHKHCDGDVTDVGGDRDRRLDDDVGDVDVDQSVLGDRSAVFGRDTASELELALHGDEPSLSSLTRTSKVTSHRLAARAIGSCAVTPVRLRLTRPS